MITWLLVFLFFMLLLAFGEIAVNIFLTKMVHPVHKSEDVTVHSTAKEN